MFLIRDREKSQVNYLRDKGKDLSRCMNTVCPTNIRKKNQECWTRHKKIRILTSLLLFNFK